MWRRVVMIFGQWWSMMWMKKLHVYLNSCIIYIYVCICMYVMY
jgi:hypothetical protein